VAQGNGNFNEEEGGEFFVINTNFANRAGTSGLNEYNEASNKPSFIKDVQSDSLIEQFSTMKPKAGNSEAFGQPNNQIGGIG